MSILCKFRQIRPFNRDFFEPLVIFCCNLSAWAQKWQRQWTETPASTEICDKTTFFWLNFHTKRPNLAQIQRIWTLWPSSFETLGHFLLYSISLSTKMTKTINTNAGKYRNLRQNNVFWLNFHTKRPNLGQIQRIWTLWPSSFETLGHFLLYSISLSTKMTKTINTNAGKYRNLRQNNVFGSISIQNVQIWAKCRQIRLFQPVFFEPLVIFWCILSGWARKCPRTSRYSLISTEICDKTTELLRFRS